MRAGGVLASTANLYAIESLSLIGRIDLAHWWTGRPVSRDYARGLLRTQSHKLPDGQSPGSPPPIQPQRQRQTGKIVNELSEAWVYIDRRDGQSYLQGWFD